MVRIPVGLRAQPMLLWYLVYGCVVGAVVGCVAGLILGLRAHPGTAWFAVIEVGFPSAVAGACLGVVVGVAVSALTAARTRR